ncbi:MAG TPA: PAS domain-containing sensor histidine kinase [Gemmatimonadaceae bacterium]|nr:PAS domain-containing sensor histidine kinase [Gemmatimonadaceae bacterium]
MSDKAKKRPAPKRVPKKAEAPLEVSTPIIPIRNSGLADAIKQGGQFYQMMVDSVRDYAIFMLDPDGHVASWNKGAQRIKGYTPSEIIGQHFSVFYPQKDITSGKPPHELKVAARVGRFEDEGWRLRKDGTAFWANVIITAVRDEKSNLIGFSKVTRDLTERRAAEEKSIADARRIAKAEASNTAKSEFLAAMSHELRTPLNAIGGYTELLALELAGPIKPEQKDYLDRIRKSQQHLLGIISDLLNYSRIEAGNVSYDIRPLALGTVIESVLPIMEAPAAAKKVQLRSETAALDCVALGDRARVDQIVLNLLSNAIRHTAAGGSVTIKCVVSRKTAEIAVIDTGTGIPKDKLDAIFEPFVQLGRSLSSAHEGMGLGLSISRDLARAMNGDLTVSSKVGEGSTFTLRLPRDT